MPDSSESALDDESLSEVQAGVGRTPSPTAGVPVVSLAAAPGGRESWDRPRAVVYLWSVFELLFVHNAWQPSSRLRCAVLRAFGAQIGSGVVIRPRVRVRFPWKLSIGNNCWIGEGVWFHNQNSISLEHDVVVSQETFLTTGTHAHRADMALLTRPIQVHAGAWVTSRCIVTGGVVIGRSALITPNTVVSESVAANTIFGAPRGKPLGLRFPEGVKGPNTTHNRSEKR